MNVTPVHLISDSRDFSKREKSSKPKLTGTNQNINFQDILNIEIRKLKETSGRATDGN